MEITEEELKKLMDQYGNCEHERQFLLLEKQKLINQIIPLEIQQQLEDVEYEFQSKFDDLDKKEKSFRKILDQYVQLFAKKIKDNLALTEKITLKSDLINVTFTKGKIVWDADNLDGYAINNPQILSFRKEEEPSVRITKNKL